MLHKTESLLSVCRQRNLPMDCIIIGLVLGCGLHHLASQLGVKTHVTEYRIFIVYVCRYRNLPTDCIITGLVLGCGPHHLATEHLWHSAS